MPATVTHTHTPHRDPETAAACPVCHRDRTAERWAERMARHLSEADRHRRDRERWEV